MFAKLRLAAVNLVISVCSSAWNNAAPTECIFTKFDILVFFKNIVEEVQVSLKND
jgi:hypothetical protein